MRFKVPQDVQQADKIVGPLTAIQLVMCIIGASIAYLFYTRVALPLNIILAIITVGITVIFVFVRLYELSFPRYVLAMTLFLLRPRVRTWRKMADAVVPALSIQQPVRAASATVLNSAVPETDIRKLGKLLDTSTLAVEDDDDLLMEESANGRAMTLERIRQLDDRLRARQARVGSENVPIQTTHE